MKQRTVIDILCDLQNWVEENCFRDETITAIISRIQFEIKLQRQNKENNKC